MDEVGEPTRPSGSSTSVSPQSAAVEPERTPCRAHSPRIDAIRYLSSPVRRVRVWEHQGHRDEGAFAPNLYHVVAQLNDCDSFRTHPRKSFAEFDDELKTGDARLAVVRPGIFLAKLITAKPRTDALTTTSRRSAAVNQILQKMPAQSSGTPPVRPVDAQPPDQVDFVSRISIAEPQRMRLRCLTHASENQELRFQNTMISTLNHVSQRCLHASEAFFEDIIEMEWESGMFFLLPSEERNINKTYGHAPRSK
jgi:hypothetical protein